MEVDLLHTLGWSMEAQRPHDFLEQFLLRSGLFLSGDELETVRRHGELFIDMCYTEVSCVSYGPAVIAAAAMYCAVCGVAAGADKEWIQIPAELKESFLHLPQYFTPEQQVRPLRIHPRTFFSRSLSHTHLFLPSQHHLLPCIREVQELFLAYELLPGSSEDASAGPETSSPSDLQHANLLASEDLSDN
jgi:hypothetical protein